MGYRIETLSAQHNRTAFDCSREELNRWLREVASQHQAKNISRTYVLIDENQPTTICGFYSLSVGQILSEHFPSSKKLPKALPIARIARLAIDHQQQGKKLGAHLLMDALNQVYAVSQVMGIHAVVVDAKDEKAALFYLKHGFSALTSSPLTLVLSVSILPELFGYQIKAGQSRRCAFMRTRCSAKAEPTIVPA